MSGFTRVVGGFSVDAVRFADGSYDVNRPGGNAFWAALGVRLSGGAVAVHSVVGGDYPTSALVRLRECGAGIDGIRQRSDIPSLRVSFSYAADESRDHPAASSAIADLPPAERARFVDNTDRAELLSATLPTGEDLVSVTADAWYLGLLPTARLREIVSAVGDTGIVVSDCPDRSELARTGASALIDVLPEVDVFLPSTSDAAVFLPEVDEVDLLSVFHDWGARSVVLKCGSRGAVVSSDGRRWRVPAFIDPRLFDPTGAGDVFGGACASTLADTGDLLSAAVAGAAAASFATAASTPLDLADVEPDAYDRRRRTIAAAVEEL